MNTCCTMRGNMHMETTPCMMVCQKPAMPRAGCHGPVQLCRTASAHLQVAPVAHDSVQLIQAGVCLLLWHAAQRPRGGGALARLPALEPVRHQPSVHDRR